MIYIGTKLEWIPHVKYHYVVTVVYDIRFAWLLICRAIQIDSLFLVLHYFKYIVKSPYFELHVNQKYIYILFLSLIWKTMEIQWGTHIGTILVTLIWKINGNWWKIHMYCFCRSDMKNQWKSTNTKFIHLKLQ